MDTLPAPARENVLRHTSGSRPRLPSAGGQTTVHRATKKSALRRVVSRTGARFSQVYRRLRIFKIEQDGPAFQKLDGAVEHLVFCQFILLVLIFVLIFFFILFFILIGGGR